MRHRSVAVVLTLAIGAGIAAFAVASLLALLALVTLGLKSFVEWRQAQVQNYD